MNVRLFLQILCVGSISLNLTSNTQKKDLCTCSYPSSPDSTPFSLDQSRECGVDFSFCPTTPETLHPEPPARSETQTVNVYRPATLSVITVSPEGDCLGGRPIPVSWSGSLGPLFFVSAHVRPLLPLLGIRSTGRVLRVVPRRRAGAAGVEGPSRDSENRPSCHCVPLSGCPP